MYDSQALKRGIRPDAWWWRLTIRSLMVVFTAVIACLIPFFGAPPDLLFSVSSFSPFSKKKHVCSTLYVISDLWHPGCTIQEACCSSPSASITNCRPWELRDAVHGGHVNADCMSECTLWLNAMLVPRHYAVLYCYLQSKKHIAMCARGFLPFVPYPLQGFKPGDCV